MGIGKTQKIASSGIKPLPLSGLKSVYNRLVRVVTGL
jgi:hypothetical protein